MKVTVQVAEQHAVLERYIAELLRSNPDSIELLKTDDHEIDRFQRMYITFEPVQLPTQTQKEHQLGTLEGPIEFQLDQTANLEVIRCSS
ncbi:hypothetical protein ACH5RR_009501 [Cinchona calisaya]|uniref:Uncharacterized protein n=1 Tax=Cinchona calisaya TaxID=153742 RepID=A0ABD3AG84_9GENT